MPSLYVILKEVLNSFIGNQNKTLKEEHNYGWFFWRNIP